MEIRPAVLLLPSPDRVARPDPVQDAGGAGARRHRGAENADTDQPDTFSPDLVEEPDPAPAWVTDAASPRSGSSDSSPESAAETAAGEADAVGKPRMRLLTAYHDDGTSGASSTPFMAQLIAQEHLSAGLHIEPWATAIAAYRQAFSASPIYGW